jgi:molecular chaperone HscA
MLGVDLGTSHTVAMLRRSDGRVRPLLFDGQPLLPSAVYLDTTGRLHVGRDAIRLGYAEPARLEPHPKRHIDAATVLLGGTEVPVTDLLAALLSAVAREAVATVGHLPPAVVTYPASWGTQRREVLATALAEAGWPPTTETRMVMEPIAAARYFVEVLRRPVPVGAALGVFDFGGGTLDIAVVRNVTAGPGGRARFEVAASGGLDDLGGLDLDAALTDHLGGTLQHQEPDAWAALTEPVTLAQWRARRRFRDDVRGAKEMLSRTAQAPVPIPDVENAVQLTRDELELVGARLIRRGVAEAETVIRAAGLAPADLAGLFLVGGSSRVPLVARLLHSELGIAPTVLEQPEFPVAEGAVLSVVGPGKSDADPVGAPPGQRAGENRSTAAFEAKPAPVEPVADTMTHSAPGSPAASPPAGGHAAGGQPDYPEPVDPWATGEAAALAEANGGMAAPVSGGPAQPWPASKEQWLASKEQEREKGARPAYRKKGLWIVAAGTVVVLGVAAGLVAWFWPGYGALDYRPLSQPVRVSPVAPVTYGFSNAALRDGRAYFASADENGQLGVVAATAGSGKVVWRSIDAGTAERWEFFFTLPHAVVAMTGTDSATSDRRMVMLDPGSGRKMWERRVASDDDVLFVGDTAVLIDRTEKRLVGLQVRGQGKVAWEMKSPQSEYGQSTTKVVTTSTVEDFAGAATAGGVAFAGATGDDARIVQIGADRSARVIDASSGKVVAGPRPNVAEPADEVIAHHGRLIVAESGDAHRVLAFDLDQIGEPKVLLTPSDTNTRFSGLTACGADRVCAVQETGYDGKTARVVAIDTANGGEVWHRDVAQTEKLVPVGEAVLAAQGTSPGQVTLLSDNGAAVWTRAGVVGRIDAGNMLLFSKALTTSADDPALSGEHLGDTAVPLGSLADVRSATCAWDSKNLACVGEKDFVLQTFTE